MPIGTVQHLQELRLRLRLRHWLRLRLRLRTRYTRSIWHDPLYFWARAMWTTKANAGCLAGCSLLQWISCPGPASVLWVIGAASVAATDVLLAVIQAIIGFELMKSQRACCDITYMIMSVDDRTGQDRLVNKGCGWGTEAQKHCQLNWAKAKAMLQLQLPLVDRQTASLNTNKVSSSYSSSAAIRWYT